MVENLMTPKDIVRLLWILSYLWSVSFPWFSIMTYNKYLQKKKTKRNLSSYLYKAFQTIKTCHS